MKYFFGRKSNKRSKRSKKNKRSKRGHKSGRKSGRKGSRRGRRGSRFGAVLSYGPGFNPAVGGLPNAMGAPYFGSVEPYSVSSEFWYPITDNQIQISPGLVKL